MNTSVVERLSRFLPLIHRPSGSDSQRTANVTSSTVPVNAALSINPRYATYYRHLSLAGHGTPLWMPEPNETQHINYRRRGAAIGDVVVFTPNGGLNFLFNICLDAHDPINGNDVPEGFSPFKPALRQSDIYRFQEYGEESYLASKSITKKRERHGPAGLWFQSSASEGAILTMPEGAYSEDLARVSGFDRYLAENLDSWYQYVNEVREWGVEQGGLHLITGVHKAKAWGIATFSNERTTAMDLHMVFRSNDDISSGDLYSWEYEGIIDSTRAGPTRRQRRIIFEGLPETEREPFENQCLFVRTVNAAIRKPEAVKDRESDAVVVPASQAASQANDTIHPTGIQSSGSAEVNRSSSSRGVFSEAHDTSVDQLGAPDGLSIAQNEPLLRDHPSKAINEFLLKEKPNGRIAITHDQDWISLLTEDDVSLPSSDELVARLKKSCKIIVDEGIISVEHKDSQLDIIASPERFYSKDQAETKDDANAALTLQTLNQDGTPKRPMNAFMIFARRRRPQVSAENQAMRTGEISKILSNEWVSMPLSEKQFYLEQAKQLKETFKTRYPDYVYLRRPNNSRKRPRSDAGSMSSADQAVPDDESVDLEASPIEGEDLESSLPALYSRPPTYPMPQAAVDHGKYGAYAQVVSGHQGPSSFRSSSQPELGMSYGDLGHPDRMGQSMGYEFPDYSYDQQANTTTSSSLFGTDHLGWQGRGDRTAPPWLGSQEPRPLGSHKQSPYSATAFASLRSNTERTAGSFSSSPSSTDFFPTLNTPPNQAHSSLSPFQTKIPTSPSPPPHSTDYKTVNHMHSSIPKNFAPRG